MDILVIAADTDELRRMALELRHRVFVIEQGVPVELERDEQDEGAFHVVALHGDECVGAGRLVRLAGRVGRVGRMAVEPRFRRQHVGDLVLAALESRARREGLREIELHAQRHVERFYERNGYVREGEVFEEAGIAHVTMRKRL